MSNGSHTKQIQELNKWMKGIDKKLNNHLIDVGKEMTKISTDVAWLKRFFWVVMTPLAGTLVAAIIALILK